MEGYGALEVWKLRSVGGSALCPERLVVVLVLVLEVVVVVAVVTVVVAVDVVVVATRDYRPQTPQNPH